MTDFIPDRTDQETATLGVKLGQALFVTVIGVTYSGVLQRVSYATDGTPIALFIRDHTAHDVIGIPWSSVITFRPRP